MTLTADEMGTLMADAALGVPPEESKLAPLNEEQLAWRREIVREVPEATPKGYIIEIPPEVPG